MTTDVTHRCPEEGRAVMGCCGRTPFEVPRWHRMTLDSALVTCRGRDMTVVRDSWDAGTYWRDDD